MKGKNLLEILESEREAYADVSKGKWLYAENTDPENTWMAIAVAPVLPEEVANPELVALFHPIQLEKGLMQHIIHLHNTFPVLLDIIARQYRELEQLKGARS